MRKQFKKIMSVVLSAAMVLSLGTSTNLRTVSADDETTTGTETTEEPGFTAMIAFQTKDDYDCRDSFDDNYYSVGQKYLEWLAENDDSEEGFDIEAHNEKQHGRNIYYNGSPDLNKKTMELNKPEKVMLNREAVANDVKMTADGTYKVSIENLDLTKNPDGTVDPGDRYFSMLYIAADIPYAEGIEIKASSVKIDGDEILTNGDVVLPQKGDKKTYVMAMLSDSYDTDKSEGVAYYGADNALRTLPTESIEIEFSISGVADWSAEKYQPKEYDFSVSSDPTDSPEETGAPTATNAPIEKFEISKPFDIGIAANVNDALTEEVPDAETETGKLQASLFGTKDYWNLLQTDPTMLSASGEASFGEHQQTFYDTDLSELETGSLHITETGEYKLSVIALGDSADLTGDGAIYFPMVPNQMPEDYTVKGDTITVGDKTYTWGAELYNDGNKSVRLSAGNQWTVGDYDTEKGNPVKDVIPVQKGDLITFTISVTGEAPAKPTATPTPTEAPPAKSYNAYLAFQTNNYIFRDEWQNKKTGMNPTDKDLLAVKYDYKKHIAFNWDKKYTVYDAAIKDAEIAKNDINYDLSISGPNLKTIKGTGSDAVTATQFNMIYISTDIPLTMKGVKCTKATLKLDGKVIKEYATVPNKHDGEGYYMFMLANAYASEADVKAGICERYEYMKENTLKVIPEKSIEVSFTISGVNFDQSTAGPAKGKTFTKGAFKYKVTKESQMTLSTKKVTKGKVTLVGLSKSGKKAKKLTIPAEVKQKQGKFKVTKIKAGALKGAKASSVTVGKNIKALPANVFKNCKKLSKLTLKAKLSSVNKKAFAGCTKKIKVAGTGKKQNLKKIKKVYKKAK